jgi:hypothetical protein
VTWIDDLESTTRGLAASWKREMDHRGIHVWIISTRRSARADRTLWRDAGFLPDESAQWVSAHVEGRAFDAVTSDPEAAGAFWRRLGGKWSRSDPEHFET